MEWKEVRLSDIGTIVGGATPSTKNPSFYDGDIPWLSPKDLSINKDKYVSRGERNITQEGYNSCSCKMLPKGSVLFSSRAPIGYIAIAANDICTNQGFKSIIPNEKTDNEFLYYLLKYNKDSIASQGSGTTFMEVSGKTMAQIEVRIPADKTYQTRIASILSSLDRKIELNNKINAQLEEMAQAIFKSWFVDFEPFKDGKFVESELGMIPEGWRVGTLGEYAKLRSGFAFKGAWWTNEGCRIIKIKNITDDGELDLADCSFVSPENTSKASAFKAYKGVVIIAMTGATIGKFCIVPDLEDDVYINQRVGKFFVDGAPMSKLPFLYNVLKEERVVSEIINRGQGSAQPNISGSDVDTIPFVIPPLNIIDRYNDLTRSTFENILKIKKENLHLSQLRDTLLPKLMSGEIDLDEIEKTI